ncbi:MAG: ATP-binding protein [Coriobacteriia bacterium]|nr:ATP-binding protein [Coriobacteriia bacterium]
MKLVQRERYIDQVLAFRDKDLIKVVTGLRRCGKSSLLTLVAEKLAQDGVPPQRIITLNLESMQASVPEDPKSLYHYFEERMDRGARAYVFIDEVQRILGWEEAVNAMRIDFDCDIYLTGSNAFLLSSELATYLSGRYIEIKMLPLTFKEYLDFKGLTFFDVEGPQSNMATDGKGFFTLDRLFQDYCQFGGMPYLAAENIDLETHRSYLNTLYQSVVTRDILNRERIHAKRTITNPELLRRLVLFLAENIGNSNSFNSITNTLKAEQLSPANATVEAYAAALVDAYLFYPVLRYDIKGKDHLKTLGKYYIADVGLRNYLLGYRNLDQGSILENIVYLQLLFNGFEVSIGKIGQTEIDFIAAKPGKRVYIQVASTLQNEDTQNRELRPFKLLDDAYPRYLIFGEGTYPTDIDGIRIVSIIDFLLGRIGEL